MEILIFIMIVLAMVAGVVWNHRNQRAATAGVEFDTLESPVEVLGAIVAIYCRGAKATMKRMFSGVTVTPVGPVGFTFSTKFGDSGEIEVHPGRNGGSTVRASTSSLFIGGKPGPVSGSGIWALSRALSNALLTMIGYAPNAARMKRFARGLERGIAHQIGR